MLDWFYTGFIPVSLLFENGIKELKKNHWNILVGGYNTAVQRLLFTLSTFEQVLKLQIYDGIPILLVENPLQLETKRSKSVTEENNQTCFSIFHLIVVIGHGGGQDVGRVGVVPERWWRHKGGRMVPAVVVVVTTVQGQGCGRWQTKNNLKESIQISQFQPCNFVKD